jgi:DNA-binding NtrC family response regulator
MLGTVKSAVSLLIIDDNPGSLDLLSNALVQPGLEILTASMPEEGLDLFCSRRPQIVLTDLLMPQMSGIEVLERIMEIDPATDVVIMPAHYSTESAVEAIKKGASDYLNKPISLGPLIERKDDLPLLERHFVARFAEQYGERNPRSDAPRADPALAALVAGQCSRARERPWPCRHDDDV